MPACGPAYAGGVGAVVVAAGEGHRFGASRPKQFLDLGGMPVLVDRSIPAMQAAFRALRNEFGRQPVFIREGGSIPVVADFQEALGLDTVLMGFGLDSDAIHSPNEHFGLDRFSRGIASSIRFMKELGVTG